MKEYINKLKHILPTFLIITIATAVGLALVRYFLTIRFEIIDIKEEAWEFWIPFILPCIPILIWLRPRFRILTFKSNTDRSRNFFLIICWCTIGAMVAISQSYLVTSTSKLQILSDIEDIEKVEKARYYKLSNFTIDTTANNYHIKVSRGGKSNEYLNFIMYFMTPIYSRKADGNFDIPKYWYAKKYQEQISNRLTDSEKERKYNEFYTLAKHKIKNHNFYSIYYFHRVPNSEDRDNYLKVIRSKVDQKEDNTFILLTPLQERYDDINGNKLFWIFGSFGIGFTILLFALIWSGYDESEKKNIRISRRPKQ